MAYPSFMFIVLTALLIGTAIAQSPSQPPKRPPKTRAPLAPAPSSGADLAPSQFAFAPVPAPSHGPRHIPGPAKSPSPRAASPAPGRGTHSPRSSIAVTPSVSSVETPAPTPMSGAVSNRLALGTLAVGLLVVSLVA